MAAATRIGYSRNKKDSRPPSEIVSFATLESEAMGKSSKDKRDAYYRLAKEQNWRARSAFKLIQLDEQFDLFSHDNPQSCTRVVDLCAAPGSWSQVLSRILIKGQSYGRRAWVERQADFVAQAEDFSQAYHDTTKDPSALGLDEKPLLQPRKNVKIVAIDLQPMAPLEGIEMLQADITHPSTVPRLLKALDGDFEESKETRRVDLVISDGAPDVTGLHDLDIYVQSELLLSALALVMKVLRPGGKFVAKIFRGKDVDLIYAQLKLVFVSVHVAKPRSSRASSLEAFVVCEDFRPIPDWNFNIRNNLPAPARSSTPKPSPEQKRTVRDEDEITEIALEDTDIRRFVAPFVACGDLSAFDSDATYTLPEGYVNLPPVQPPTAPPYKEALEKRRADGGALGKTAARKLVSREGGGELP